ncbi:hypothetical protein K8T06_08115 [bacterium]|nr:hypothetical protein [bacterium]
MSELNHMILEKCLNNFIKNPTVADFDIIFKNYQMIEKTRWASFIESFWEIAALQQKLILYKYLGSFLLLKQRFVEAQYYLGQWIESNPNDENALFKFHYCVLKRSDIILSHWCVKKFEENTNISNQKLLAQKTMHSLVMGCDQSALKQSSELELNVDDPLFANVVFEVANRLDDPSLMAKVFISKGGPTLHDDLKDTEKIRTLLLTGLMTILKRKVKKESGQ